MARFNICFQNEEEFTIELSENIIIVESGDIPYYDGPYDIVPKSYSDIWLETEAKRMRSDVKIHKVPFYKTSNESGITVYIGGDE